MSQNRLFLGYETAFWIWRKAGPLAFSALMPSRVRPLAGGAPTHAMIERFRSEHPDLMTVPLHAVVKPGDQRSIPDVVTHVRSTPLPDRSFFKLDDDTFVASPELCLMQLAPQLSEAQAVKLAMEMCGSYAIDLLNDDPGFEKRPALTDASKIRRFAAKMYAPNSRAHGTKFLRWIADGSASPRETALCMLLCMPPRLGGYGIAMPELNRRIELSLNERFMIGAHHFDCDLYWPGKGVAVEYDSARHHTAIEKQERDAIRRNMLQHKNIQVIVATRAQVSSEGKFDGLARQIARAVGKRLRVPEKEHVAARAQLRDVLFSWDVNAEVRSRLGVDCWQPDGEGVELAFGAAGCAG